MFESILLSLAPQLIKTIGAAFGIDTESDAVKAQRQDAELALMKAIHEHEMAILQQQTAQIDVNKTEAANPNLFVSGWRPSVGWVCVAVFAYHGLLLPFLLFASALFHWTVPVPSFDISMFTTVLMGMLGLGAMRTFEKWQGVAMNGPAKKIGDSATYAAGTSIEDIVSGKAKPL